MRTKKNKPRFLRGAAIDLALSIYKKSHILFLEEPEKPRIKGKRISYLRAAVHARSAACVYCHRNFRWTVIQMVHIFDLTETSVLHYIRNHDERIKKYREYEVNYKRLENYFEFVLEPPLKLKLEALLGAIHEVKGDLEFRIETLENLIIK